MSSRLASSAAAALRRRQDPKLAEKFNLATLNGGKSPFVVSSNRLLQVTKKPQQLVADKFSLEYLLGPQTDQKPQKKNPFHVASSKLIYLFF
ncbi:hypothetical protein PHYPSEUDO_011870 [Phytophthora pseudosyringae]|uniref:Uncharacterized protein n=1 Tax=Phytophthora pseudosyringae TaxID=221518 RepID=A0A8T1VAK9_9STRA|nr:hypothetical protein PHYPSEUDO_011870 [Phytophthora pseudosyringae]